MIKHDFPVSGLVYKVRFSPDGLTLAIIECGIGVSLLDAESGRLIWKNTDQQGNPSFYEPTVNGLAFDAHSKTLAVCMAQDTRAQPARVLNATTGKEICRFDSGGGPFVFSQDGKGRIFAETGNLEFLENGKKGRRSRYAKWMGVGRRAFS